MFQSLEELKSSEFVGFHSVNELRNKPSLIPKKPGVYLILNIEKRDIDFLPIGTGGHFKKKDPNKDIPYLTSRWVNDTHLLYIGKAGGDNNSTLYSRLKLYFDFGNGKHVGHYGGRLIWQLYGSSELIVCWKPIEQADPRTVEKQLISDFKLQYGSRPFANING